MLARFSDVREADPPTGSWTGPQVGSWRSSTTRDEYVDAVERVRARIADGDVYQANVCRVLAAPLPDPARADLAGLASLLASGNPAPYAGAVDLPAGCHPAVPAGGVRVVTASPELFLSRDGDVVVSGPIKGTGRTAGDLTPKDDAENVMIVDLVRNDLGAVSRTGSVSRTAPAGARGAPRSRAPGVVRPRRAARRHRLGAAAGRDLPARAP